MHIIKLCFDTDYYLAVKITQSKETIYCFSTLTLEDEINRNQGKPIRDPVLSDSNLKLILNPNHYKNYLIGSTQKQINKIESMGDTRAIKFFYDYYRQYNNVIRGIDYKEDNLIIKYLYDIPNFRFQVDYTKTEDWFLNTKIVSSVSGFKTIEQLRKIRDLSKIESKDYKIVTDISELKEYCKNELLYTTDIGNDTETDGTEFYDYQGSNNVVGFVLSWKKDQSIYIPVYHTKMDNLPLNEVIPLLKPVLEKVPNIFHNAMFDLKVYHKYGIDPLLGSDTMVLLHRLRPAGYKVGHPLDLKTNTHLLLGLDTLKLSEVTGTKNETLLRFCDPEVVRVYACPDADTTRQIHHLIFDNIATDKDNIQRIPDYQGNPTVYRQLYRSAVKVYKNDMAFMQEFAKEEYLGVPCNKELLLSEIQKEKDELKVLEKEIYSFVGRSRTIDMYKKTMTLPEIKSLPVYKNAEVTFDISKPKQLKKVIFNVLKYPPTALLEKSNELSLTKADIKNFLREDLKTSSDLFDEDIKSDTGSVIIEKSELNFKKYPFARLLQEYRDRYKNITSFLSPMYNSIRNGRIFTSYSFTRADTRRLIDKLQTLKKSLKKAIVDTPEWYYIVFDCAQEEIRIMDEMSGFNVMIEKLNHPEKDSHRESGAMFLNKPPHKVTSEERGDIKGVAFGKPYGMGVYSLMLRLRKPPYTEKVKQEVEVVNHKWELGNRDVVNLLEAYRKMAIEKGYIINKWGDVIYYDAYPGMPEKEKARLSRQTGNSPIQSYASTFLKIVFNRIIKRLNEEGIRDKVRMPTNVHDEIGMWVHRSIHPYHVYDIISKAAFLVGLNNMHYYWGISIISNWLEGKKDEYEAPVLFVQQKAKEWREGKYKDGWMDNQKEFVFKDMTDWIFMRFENDVKNILKIDLDKNSIIDLDTLMEEWDNYFIRGRFPLYTKAYRKPEKGEDKEIPAIEKYFLYKWGEVNLKYKGKVYRLSLTGEEVSINYLVGSKEQDKEQQEEENYQSVLNAFDDEQEVKEEEDDFEIISEKGETIFDRVKFKGINTKTFNMSDRVIIEKDTSFIVPIDGLKKQEYEKLITELSTNKGDRQIIFKFNKKFFPSKIYVNAINIDLLNKAVPNGNFDKIRNV